MSPSRARLDGHRLIVPARRLAGDGLKAWQEVLERGYEGLESAAPYVGGRTLAWLKVKQSHDHEGGRGWESKRR
jgi:ATP-dependent DNA ligase